MNTTLCGTWFWEPKVRESMQNRFQWRTPSQTKFTDETVRTLHRAYVVALTNGGRRFSYVTAPAKNDLGVPTGETAALISKIGKSTGLGLEPALAFAASMFYLFSRGEIGQDIFDPIVKLTETKTIQEKIPAGKSVLDVLTTGAKTAGMALPVALVAGGVLLFLVYVPRPRR